DVNVACFQCLLGEQGRMPSSQDNGKLRVPLLDGLCGIHGVFDHRPGYHGDPEAESVLDLVKNTLLVIGRYRGIDDANLETSAEKWSRDRQEPQRRRGFNACKRWNK